MKKKVSLSFSDNLAEKIEVHQEYLGNSSTPSQEAIKNMTNQRESCEKTLKGGPISMEQIVERLRQERIEAENDYRQRGEDEGLDFAKTASYTDLKYAACTFEPISDRKYYFYTSLFDDQVLGEYFQEYFGENPELHVNCQAVGEYRAQFLNNIAEEWIDGWLEGVREFWGEVEDKL